MADTNTNDDKTQGDPPSGLNEAVLAQSRDDPDPGGTGDLTGGEPSGGLLSGSGATTAGLTDELIASEAAALGPADGSLSDSEGGASTPTMGETLGEGAGRATAGSGTPGDRGETGGGGPSGQHGGTGPKGTASPGGDSRR
ncbi:MAG: hypothetical protein ACK4SZ_05275 [Allosphingosinicella sp.]|uniref:hypothetical protein n=1 Tax=Allosphingosinicella sp. TaxID=2823234 RepID=UPI00394191C2